MLRRDRDLYLALPIVILAAFPAIQIVHLLPDLPGAESIVSDVTRGFFGYAIFAWMLLLAMRAVYVCEDPQRPRRRACAVGGGLLLIAPIWFAPLVGPLDPWWREFDAGIERPRRDQSGVRAGARGAGVHDGPGARPARGRAPRRDRSLFRRLRARCAQPGFVTDVDAAQHVMDERWHTNGRSVVLRQQPADRCRAPFATITHLREVLLEIGDTIDADDDIVMLYLDRQLRRRSHADRGQSAARARRPLAARTASSCSTRPASAGASSSCRRAMRARGSMR